MFQTFELIQTRIFDTRAKLLIVTSAKRVNYGHNMFIGQTRFSIGVLFTPLKPIFLILDLIYLMMVK